MNLSAAEFQIFEFLESAKQDCGPNNFDDMYSHLYDRFDCLTDLQLLEYSKAMDSLYNRLSVVEISYAAELAFNNGVEGFSDDAWEYHKGWLLSLGIDDYQLVVSNPDKFYSQRSSRDGFQGVFNIPSDILLERGVKHEVNRVKLKNPYVLPPKQKLQEMFPLITSKLN